MWELLEASNVPVVSHIGGGGSPVRRGFHDNGRPVTDFLGGGENVRSKDFMAIHQRPEVFWGAMVLDGIFDRYPGLTGASIEEGAMWVVSWIRRLDLPCGSPSRSRRCASCGRRRATTSIGISGSPRSPASPSDG